MALDGVDQLFSKAFTEFVIEGMYKYVRPTDNSDIPNRERSNSSNGLSADLDILDFIGRDDSLDLLKLNLPARLLVILANVSYLQGDGLRLLLNLFAKESLPISPNAMLSALANVERAVTQLFLQDQVGKIIGPVELSWLDTLPRENSIVSLSPAVYKSLLSLADVQSLIVDVSPKDPLPLLRELVNSMIAALLSVLKTKRLTLDQTLQARVDLEFLKRKFEESSLLNSESVELLEKCVALLANEHEGAIDFYSVWGQFESNWTGPFLNLFTF